MSSTLSLHHIVFNTYRRENTISAENEEALYRYIWNILKGNNCTLIRIGGIENHIHLLVDIHPSISLANLIAEIKRKTSYWMKRSGLFPHFKGWAKEYFAFSKSQEQKDVVINYIKNQKQHHKGVVYDEEIKMMVVSEGLAWEDICLS